MCLIAQSSPQPGQVYSQGPLIHTNADRVTQKARHDQACVTNSLSSFEINDQHRHQISCCVPKKSSVKEASIQNPVNPFFEIKWKEKISSQLLHGTKTVADIPHDCQVEEEN